MGPDLEEVLAYLRAYATKVSREKKFPLWTRDEVESECWLLWHDEILMKHKNNLHERWRGLAKLVFNRRLPDIYQRSLGKKIRRTKDHGRTYHTDADLGYISPNRTEQPQVQDVVIPTILRAMKSLQTYVETLK